MKTIAKCEKQKRIAWYFASLFCILRPFFRFSQHSAPGLAFAQKIKGSCGLFFRSINKTQNSLEIQKVYSECFVFCGVFLKNISEIPAKCEIRKVYSRPYSTVYNNINLIKLFLNTVYLRIYLVFNRFERSSTFIC